jgi:type IV secretory pathway VirB6-like protein
MIMTWKKYIAECFFRHTYIKMAALLLVVFSVLTGCDGSGCKYADDWGDKVSISVTVNADTEFTGTGITVYKDEPLFMRVGGVVDLCPDNTLLGSETVPTSIVPTTDAWQNSGYRVSAGDWVTIVVDGYYTDRTGNRIENGRGLYAIISDAAGGTSTVPGEYDDDWWYGRPNADTLNSTALKTASEAPEFFELWNNGTAGIGSGYMGTASRDGYVWFKYARTANPGDNANRRQLTNSGEWDERWSPWKGFYSWARPECPLCRHETIGTMCAASCSPCAALFVGAGICFVACVGGCWAAVEEVCRSKELSPGHRKCINDKDDFVVGAGSDRWCGENNNGGGDHSGCYDWPPNARGYDITIGAGCPGSAGKYLYAYFANGNQDAPVRRQVFTPMGCDPSNRATCTPVFRNGRPLYTDMPHVDASTPNFSMYYKTNSNFDSNGIMKDDVVSPYTGRLWFKIQDDQFKPSDLITRKKEGDAWRPADCSEGSSDCCVEPAECVDNPHFNILNSTGDAQRPACNSAVKSGYTRFGYDENGQELGDCRPARGYTGHSDNIGSYDVYIETTKIGGGFSAFLTGLVNTVRGILFGECMTDENMAEQSCFTRGYCMDARGGKNRCESDFSGTWVDGVGCTDGTAGCVYGDDCTCSAGTTQTRSSLDQKFYCLKPMTYSEARCSELGMIYSDGDCVFDTRIGSGECRENGGTWVPTRNDWKPGIAQRMYNQLIAQTDVDGTRSTNAFLNAVRAALVLYIVLFAFSYMMGIVETPQKEFVFGVIRIAIILQLISPDSWEFFHYYLFTIFTDGMADLISMVSGQFMGVMSNVGDNVLIDPITGGPVLDAEGARPSQMLDTSGNPMFSADGAPIYDVVREEDMRVVKVGVNDPFSFANQTIAMFFSTESQSKLVGLFFSMFPLGMFYAIFIYWGMYTYVMALIKATILYILAMMAIALLLAVAPIFISFLLFSRTRGNFDKWAKQLMNFLFQPVLVLTALALFNVFVYSALYMTLHYDVCWGCVLRVEWPIPLINETINFCVFYSYTTWGGAGDGAIPMGFYLILILIIMANVAYKMNDWMAKIAAELTSGDLSTALGNVASAMGDNIKGGAVAATKAAAKSTVSVVRAGASKAKKAVTKESDDDK